MEKELAEMIVDYIRPELFILIPFLYALGFFLKKWEGFEKEWQIPFIILGVGIIFSILWAVFVLAEGLNFAVIIIGIVQGVLIASVPVMGNELIKQWTVKRPK